MKESRFVVISLDEMRAFALNELGFEVLNHPNPNTKQELYGRLIIPGGRLLAAFSSTINVYSGAMAEYGAKAIDCYLWDSKTQRPPYSIAHVKRTEGWMERVQGRMRFLWSLVYYNRCSNCHSEMILRGRDKDKFFGCIRYPECTWTKRSADHWKTYNFRLWEGEKPPDIRTIFQECKNVGKDA